MDIASLPSFIPAASSSMESPVSTLGSFSRGAFSMIPLGKQAYAGAAGLAEGKPYTQERQELDTEEGQDKAMNPTARILGQITGVVAPAIATGGASAPESLGEAALTGAGVGAGFGAGNAVDELAGGGSKLKAAGDVALGAGLGAAGGAAGFGAAKVLGNIAEKLGPDQAETRAQAIAGLFNGTTRQVRALPGKNPTDTMNAIGDAIANRTVDGEKLIDTFDRMPERLDKFISFRKQAGQVIGDTIKESGVPDIPIGGVANALETSMKLPNPMEQDEMASLVDKVRLYANKNKEISFDRLQQLKSDIGDTAFKGQGNIVKQNAYHAISDIQDSYLDQVSNAVKKTAFDQAKHDYQVASRVIPMMRMGVSREIGQKVPTFLPAMAAVTGHPVGALGALMKNRIGQIGAGAAFKTMNAMPEGLGNAASRVPAMAGASMAAQEAPAGKGATPNFDHPALAPYKPQFMKAIQGAKTPQEANKRGVVYDYVLASNDPNYAKAKQDSEEN